MSGFLKTGGMKLEMLRDLALEKDMVFEELSEELRTEYGTG